MQTKSRRRFLVEIPLVAGILLAASRAHAEHYPAMLCGDCSFGSKKDNCAKCGKWVGSHRQLAYICNDCGFGSKKDNCVVCGKWAP